MESNGHKVWFKRAPEIGRLEKMMRSNASDLVRESRHAVRTTHVLDGLLEWTMSNSLSEKEGHSRPSRQMALARNHI